MYKYTLLTCLSALFLCFGNACKNEPASAEKSTTPVADTIKMGPTPSLDGAAEYTVTEGTIFWAAKKSMGGQHNGTITVKSGNMKVNEGQLLAGNIVMDMGSVQVVDLKDPGEKNDLESHLKDTDFFEAAKFPESTFVINDIFPGNQPAFDHVISGDLTMKGKTSSVNIPVKLTLSDTELVATSASFIINRTKWGINFHSGILGTAKDKLIEDNVMLSLTLKAKKQ